MDDLTFQEAATLIGKNLRTIQRHIKNGKLSRHPSHAKDGKNFISRSELEQKFGKVSKKPEEKPSGEAEASKPQAAAEDQVPKSPPERQNYEEKWINEIQKHAQTREELGVWKGRAEAYQAFASRLLGSGEKIDLDQNHPESMRNNAYKKDEPVVNRSPQMPNSLIYYIAFAVLFVILILLFVLIRIYTS